eukprot:TRINITY_DN15086_c0_g1_i1.p1 TRINITY_DN15086_c0_g1~~TRINITY_DN15086_c0_g1_i1.p1  ORF type:complete len:2532 (+),score=450.67 TRINITY_DN15086_c0_g1_i1:101-7696(+)
MSNPGFMRFQHVFFLTSMSVAVAIAPSYTSAAFVAIILFHCCFHDVRLAYDDSNGKTLTRISPKSEVCIVAGLVSFGHMVAVGVCNILEKESDLWEGFGIYQYHHLDRMLRHTIPHLFITVAAVLKYKARTGPTTPTYLIVGQEPTEDDPLIETDLEAVEDHSQRKLSPLSMPVLTIASGGVTVLWPRVMTSVYLILFLGTVSYWGLSGKRGRISPGTLQNMTGFVWLLCTISIIVQFASNMLVIKTFIDDHEDTLNWIGIKRFETFEDLFSTSTGRQYAGHCGVLAFIYFLSWHSCFVALSASRCIRLQVSSSSDEDTQRDDEKPAPRYEFNGLLGPEEDQERVNDDGVFGDEDEEVQMQPHKEAKSPSESDIHWSAEQQQQQQQQERNQDGSGDIPASELKESTDILVDDLVIIDTPRSDATITAKQTSIGTILARYSPHLLCIVLGLTAILDPSFLSAVWLIALIVFMYCALNSNIDLIIKTLPFAIVWSAMHVIAIYVASIPGVVESDSKYVDKLSAIGIARHGGSTLVLTAHGCLMLLVAIVKKFSRLAEIKDDANLSESRNSLPQISNPTINYIKDWLLSKAQFITLLILVVVGCLHIDLIQSSFILFFVIFATSPRIAQKYWKVLLVWEIIVTLFLYSYNVAVKGWDAPESIGNLSWSTLVAEPFDSMWELTPYLLLIFFSIWQLRVFQLQEDGSVSKAILPPKVARLRASVSLAVVWFGLLLVTLLANPTLMTGGYFILFIWVAVVVELRDGGTQKQLFLAWGVGIVYSASCFVSLYLFQFDSMADIFSEVFNAILACEGGENKTRTDCVHETGFRTYEKVSTRVTALLPHWVIFALIVYQITCIRRVWALEEEEEAQHEETDRGEEEETRNRGMLKIPQWVQDIYSTGVKFIRRLIIVLCGSAVPYMLLLVLWIAASQERSVICAGYHILLMVFIFWPSTKFAPFIAIYSVLSVAVKFWYQYTFFPSFVSETTATYFGIFAFDSTWMDCVHCSIKHQTWTDLIVWVFTLLFMRARRWAGDDLKEAIEAGSVPADWTVMIYIWNLTIFKHDDTDVEINERVVTENRELNVTYECGTQVDLRNCETLLSATCNDDDKTEEIRCIVEDSPEFEVSSTNGFDDSSPLVISYIRKETTFEKIISMVIYISQYTFRKVSYGVDHSLRVWSLEFLMFIMLVIAAANPYIFESFIYLGMVLYLRHRQRDSYVVPVVLVCSLLFSVREFFYVGMPVQHLWGPFKGKDNLDNTAWEFYNYFGCYPDRRDTFAAFTVLVASMYHYHVVHIMKVKTKIIEPYGTSTLTEFMNEMVTYKDAQMPRREACLKITHNREPMSVLEEMLPRPARDDLAKKPANWRRRVFGIWMKMLPYWCLFFVFIDATAAEFVTLLRMGKLAVAMILLKEWDRMQWRGNSLWKYINDYFLFCLVFHMIFNIPKLATAWEDNRSVSKLYSFLGIIECTWVDSVCVGSLIQVNFWEVTIMCLLYLQRVNYDNFDSIFLMYQAHEYRLNATSIRELISERLAERVAEGKRKAEAMQEERKRILESTKREPRQLLHKPTEKRVFSSAEYYEDGSTSEEDKELRQRKRHAFCMGYLVGGRFNEAFGVDSSSMTGRGQRKELVTSFREGKSKTIPLPEPLPEGASLEEKTQILMDLLNQPPASLGLLETSLTTQRLEETAQLEPVSQKDSEPVKQSKVIKLAKYLHSVTLLGDKNIPDSEMERKPWSYLHSGATLYLKEHSDKICFIIFAINYSVSVSILDMLVSMSVFVYALLVHPRPSSSYWNFALTYMLCLLALKCIIQSIEVTFGDFLPGSLDSFTSSIGSTSFFANVLGDYCAIVAVTARQAVLRSWGLDADTEAALKRTDSNLSRSTARSKHSRHSRHSHAPAEPFFKKVKRVSNFYFRNVTSPEGKIGRTRDLYIPSFSIDLLCLVLFIGLYSKVGDNKNFDLGEAISQNLLPGSLVLGMIVIVVCMVIDRVIYLCSAVHMKLYLQWLMVLGYHFGYFIWYQAYNENGKSGHAAGAVLFITRAMWLALSALQIDCGYPEVRRHDCFTHSDSQYVFIVYTALRAIPFLWELRVLLDWTCAKTTLKLAYWLKLEDLRNEVYARKMDIIDNKMTNPENKPGEPLPIQKKLGTGWLLIFVILVLIFFPLLYYSTFSPALKTNSAQQVTVGLAFDGTPAFYTNEYLVPVAKQRKDGELANWLNKAYPAMENQNVRSSQKNVQFINFNNNTFSSQKWSITQPAALQLAKELNDSINPETRGDNTPSLVLSVDVQRTQGLAGTLDQKRFIKYSLSDPDTLLNLSHLLAWDNFTSESPAAVLHDLYSPFMYNKPQSLDLGSTMVDCTLSAAFANATELTKYYTLVCDSLFACGNLPTDADVCLLDPTAGQCYYNTPYSESHHTGKPECPIPEESEVPLYFVVVSDYATMENALSGLFDVGIIALYVTFVLAVGQVIRGFISGSAGSAPIQDMADPSTIARLADHVHLARSGGDLKLEEELYCHLINILRSPETLMEITGDRVPPTGVVAVVVEQ